MGLAYRHPFTERWFVLRDGEWGNRASWRQYPPHAGVDYNIEGGSSEKTIRAIANGYIRGRGWSETYGNRVWIEHDDGMWSHYAHMFEPSWRTNGDRVVIGQPIGRVGNTGSASNGAHLHLEVAHSQWACNDGNQSIDPIKFINNNPGTTPEPEPAPVPVYRRNSSMSSLYYKTEGGVLWALAGDGQGTAAWLETGSQTLANQLAEQHGPAAYLSAASFANWKKSYLGLDLPTA